MINYKELFEKAKEIEKENRLSHYEILQRFMFERILERISVSKYQTNFILKGGLLLSAMFGINNRSTRDMDTAITGLDVSKENMVNILNEILSIDLKDGVKFELVDISDIRTDDEYGGNKYQLFGKLENLKVLLEIDISTGDKITPKQLKFEYPLLFEDRKIMIDSYNMETILAEKIETILRRSRFNARMKDFYDVYCFLTKYKKAININDFKTALYNTLDSRNSMNYFTDYNQILDYILSYKDINTYWNKYQSKYKYAEGIKFSDIIKELRSFLDEIDNKEQSIKEKMNNVKERGESLKNLKKKVKNQNKGKEII